MPPFRRLAQLAIACVIVCGLAASCIGVSQNRAPPGATGVPDSEIKVCRAGTVAAADGLIDDFEDANTQGQLLEGRDGYWWPKKDDVGSTFGPDPFAPSEGGADGSAMAMRGSGRTSSAPNAWGAGFGVNFLSQKTGALYDASKHAGIAFKARVDEKSTRHVRFKIGDVNTHADAGICKTCWNHFGKDLTLTPKWKTYTVLFSEAQQEPFWGDPRPAVVTPSKLVAIDWSIGTGQDFDVWIDDLTFVDCR